ncbi:transcriptional repressor BetI [Arthrobacter agilis]|nr:transcriptional repressor BetI [Arthrobacter agilis]
MDEILGRAQVSPATLYAHFGNKDGLVVEALRRRLSRWEVTWQACVDEADTPEDKVLALFTALARHRSSHTPSRWCVFLGAAAETPSPGSELASTLADDTRLLVDRLESIAQEHLAGVPARVLAHRISLVYTGVLGMILRGSEVDPVIAEGRAIAALAIRSLADGAAPADT